MKDYVKILSETHAELVNEYSLMSKEQLLNQICAEVLDLLRMEERVQTFMSECTMNMSNTTYTIESIKTLITQKQEHDIQEFCKYISEDSTDEEIINEVKAQAELVN